MVDFYSCYSSYWCAWKRRFCSLNPNNKIRVMLFLTSHFFQCLFSTCLVFSIYGLRVSRLFITNTTIKRLILTQQIINVSEEIYRISSINFSMKKLGSFIKSLVKIFTFENMFCWHTIFGIYWHALFIDLRCTKSTKSKFQIEKRV